MKTLKLAIAGIALFFSVMACGQVSVTVSGPPPWGPAEASGVRFYYLPDIQMYFDVNTGEYVYFSGGTWVRTTTVPAAYRHYDFYKAYKVPLRDYQGDRPWEKHAVYHKNYPKEYHRGEYQKPFVERQK